MELPTSPDQPLQGLLNPRESAAGNLQKQAALQHTCK